MIRFPRAVPLLLSLVTACCLAAPLAAQVPTTLNYQGRLLQNTADQDAVGGTVDIVFSIWSGPASDGGATRLWSETWNGISLSNGIFSVLLGSNGTPLDPADFQDDSSLYLQLAIDGETLLPRQQLGSAPFAMVDEPENEFQDLSLADDTLALSDSSATVDLSPYLDNTDEQTLDLSGNTLSISGSGSSVDLASFVDDMDNQVLSRTGNNLQLTSDDGTDTVASLPISTTPTSRTWRSRAIRSRSPATPPRSTCRSTSTTPTTRRSRSPATRSPSPTATA